MEHVKGNILKYIDAVIQDTSLFQESNCWWFQSILGQLYSCILLCLFNLRKHYTWLYTWPLLHWRWDMVIQVRRFSLGAGRAQKYQFWIMNVWLASNSLHGPISVWTTGLQTFGKEKRLLIKTYGKRNLLSATMNGVTNNIQCCAK